MDFCMNTNGSFAWRPLLLRLYDVKDLPRTLKSARQSLAPRHQRAGLVTIIHKMTKTSRNAGTPQANQARYKVKY